MSLNLTDDFLLLANDQFFEIIHRVQGGVSRSDDLKQRTFGVTDGPREIISRKHVAHLGRADVLAQPIRSGSHPDAHGERATAENVRFLHHRRLAVRRGCTSRRDNRSLRLGCSNVRSET